MKRQRNEKMKTKSHTQKPKQKHVYERNWKVKRDRNEYKSKLAIDSINQCNLFLDVMEMTIQTITSSNKQRALLLLTWL